MDYSGAHQCYSPASKVQRCFNKGAACKHALRTDVAVYKRTVANVVKYFPEKKSWTDALAACQKLGPHWSLAMIGNKADNDAVAALIGTDHAWIGFTDHDAESKWQWIGGDSTYTNWRKGEPNNVGANGEDCAMIYGKQYDNQWISTRCMQFQRAHCTQALRHMQAAVRLC